MLQFKRIFHSAEVCEANLNEHSKRIFNCKLFMKRVYMNLWPSTQIFFDNLSFFTSGASNSIYHETNWIQNLLLGTSCLMVEVTGQFRDFLSQSKKDNM